MAEAISVSRPISGTDLSLTFETGSLAPQSQGAVVVSIGDTRALVTANGASHIREGIDFFPLTVDVEEKAYAAGKIPGSFFRKEGRPSDNAVLTCRLIDRPLRPSFADGYRNETQVVVTVLGADQENPYDIAAINGASAALMISGLPFEGPIGAVRVAYSADGEWIPHPSYADEAECTFQLVVAGRAVGDDIAIMMVEAGGTEGAWDIYEAGAPKVTEEVIAGGLEAAKTWIRESIELQRELVAEAGSREPLAWEPQVDTTDEIAAAVAEIGESKLAEANDDPDRRVRDAANATVKAEILAELTGAGKRFEGADRQVKNAIKALTKSVIRRRVVDEGRRMDGRGLTDLRALSAEVGVVPTAHGSGLFQRGETQVLNMLALGMPKMDQLLDTISPETHKRYMHHYNMPPYANGETGRMGGTKRREVGHGHLAEMAVLPVVPSKEDWPYALRLVSEVLSSNGSTSMASVCSSSMSLMDGGVPIKAPVAGIAMGLIHEDDAYLTLTDIQGAEDAFGDMDFKVAGTAEFVTALQLDTKIDGLPADVLAAALSQARDARLEILDVMAEAIAAPRDDVGDSAPKLVSFEIPIDKIGEVIGPKGKVINTITAETGADVSVDDDGMVGTVTIGAVDKLAVEEAERQVRLILDPPTADIGAVYTGKVVNITKFGAFVNILPGRDGLLHISKIGGKRRIDKVEDELTLGQEVEVRVDDIDPNGKISLVPTDTGSDDDGSSDGTADRGSSNRKRSSGNRGGNGNRNGGDAGGEPDGDVEVVSFADSFDAEASDSFGDLGPSKDRGDRGGSRRGGGRRRR